MKSALRYPQARETAVGWKSIIDARSGRMPGYGYKLANEGQYAIDLVLPDALDINPSKMSVWIVFADGNRRDGVGDVTEVAGLVLDRHRKNPLALFDHGKTQPLPIGLSEDRDTEAYTVEIDPIARTARGNVFFYQGKGISGVSGDKEYEHAIYCAQLYHLIAEKLIRSGSYAYQVIEGRQIPADYAMGTPAGLHLVKTLLLEFGPTVLPANADTVRKSGSWGWDGADAARKILAMPLCCGHKLSPVLVKSLSACAGEKKSQMGFTGDLAWQREESKEGEHRGKSMKAKGMPNSGLDADQIGRVLQGGGIAPLSVDPDGDGFRVSVPPDDINRAFQLLDHAFGDAEQAGGAIIVRRQGRTEGIKALRKKYGKKSFKVGDRVAVPDGRTGKVVGQSNVYNSAEGMQGYQVKIDESGRTEVYQDSQLKPSWTNGKKSTLPIPHGDLSKTSIPPAKWKPGMGASCKGKKGGYTPAYMKGHNAGVEGQPKSSNPYRQHSPGRMPEEKEWDDGWEKGSKLQNKSLFNAKVKAIRVRYRNKVMKGIAEVELKFDLSNLDIEKQNAFLQDMHGAGYGLPSQGHYLEHEPPKLGKPIKGATFIFDIQPPAEGVTPGNDDVAESIREAIGVAGKHGATFLGNSGGTKSLNGQKSYDAGKCKRSIQDAVGAINRCENEAWEGPSEVRGHLMDAREALQAAARSC